MKKKNMEIFVHFIYNVVQIKEHIDQYFHAYFIRFELNKYLFFNIPVTPARVFVQNHGFSWSQIHFGIE